MPATTISPVTSRMSESSESVSSTMIAHHGLPGKPISSATEHSVSERIPQDMIRALVAGTSPQAIMKTTVPVYANACLALTCSKFYHAYKLVYPGPIEGKVGSCWADAKGHKWEYAIQCHIGDFLGSTYRRHRFESRFIPPFKKWSPFVSRAVYGNIFSMKEAELNERYSDWGSSLTSFCPRMSALFKDLPSPYGMAEDWYTVSFTALSKFHSMGYKGAHAKREGFRGRPEHLYVYRGMMKEYEEFYNAFGEWVVMMGV
ncbi:hypothetical protein IFR05_004573 [Cadophora sp. M221]|nr:hypothetical protein IFR05_004573 [Cadophora sp. M221]